MDYQDYKIIKKMEVKKKNLINIDWNFLIRIWEIKK